LDSNLFFSVILIAVAWFAYSAAREYERETEKLTGKFWVGPGKPAEFKRRPLRKNPFSALRPPFSHIKLPLWRRTPFGGNLGEIWWGNLESDQA